MKKTICLIACVMAVMLLLSACNFNTFFQGNTNNVATHAPDKTKEMLTALESKDIDKALSLMRKEVAPNAKESIMQMAEYLNGRKVENLEQTNINVSSSMGTDGTIRQERIEYRATLGDGTTLYIVVNYVIMSSGEGFNSFQMVLGVV